MKISPGVSLSRKYLEVLDPQANNFTTGEVPIKAVKFAMNDVMMVQAKFGGQNLWTVIDTGSADTWVIDSKFTCKNSRLSDPCNPGPAYNRSSSFLELSDQVFSTAYQSGEYMTGYMGTETIDIGQITVPGQQIGVVKDGKYHGDGTSSGLIGLGFPSITNAYPKNNTVLPVKPANRPPRIPYDPIFTNMYKKGLVSPFFSVAVPRSTKDTGALAFGGLPGPSIQHTNQFSSAPFEYLNIKSTKPPKDSSTVVTPPEYKFYAITLQGFKIATKEFPDIENVKTQVIIDTGSTLTMLPETVVAKFYQNWIGGEKIRKDWITNTYLLPCNTKSRPPKFGLDLKGGVVWFDSEDLILPASGDLCMGAIQPIPTSREGTGGGLAILGAAFLKNVVAVFDVGAGEMRFANRIRS